MKRLRSETDLDIMKKNDLVVYAKDKNGDNKLVLSNPIIDNVTDEYWATKKIRATLEMIAKTLAASLGPDGSTTILQRKGEPHLITKDGLDIIGKINFQDNISDTILDLVKDISQSQVLAVGDGSTSAIIVANAIYQELTDSKNRDKMKFVSPQTIVDMMSVLSDWLEKEIGRISKKVSPDYHELEKIAAIAMNNDPEVGKKIREIYRKIGPEGNIVPDAGLLVDKDTIEYKSGIDWKRGYIDPIYISSTEALDGKITYDKPDVVIIKDDYVTYDKFATFFANLLQTEFIRDHVINADKELLIVVHHIDLDCRNMLKTNRAQKMPTASGRYGSMNFTVVDIAGATNRDRNAVEDLSTLCGTIQIDSTTLPLEQLSGDALKPFIGKAAKVEISEGLTTVIADDKFLTDDQKKKKADLIKSLQASHDNLNEKSMKTPDDRIALFELNERISNLSMSNAIYHVGGKSYAEQNERQRNVEDAIFAARSALKHGYVVGGNLIVPRILYRKREKAIKLLKKNFKYLKDISFFEFFVDLLRDSFLQSYKTVLDNSQALSDDEIDTIVDTCLKKNVFYNLKTHKYEKDTKTNVINSADTDVSIMKSCISLMSRVGTSNQIIVNGYSNDYFDAQLKGLAK